MSLTLARYGVSSNLGGAITMNGVSVVPFAGTAFEIPDSVNNGIRLPDYSVSGKSGVMESAIGWYTASSVTDGNQVRHYLLRAIDDLSSVETHNQYTRVRTLKLESTPPTFTPSIGYDGLIPISVPDADSIASVSISVGSDAGIPYAIGAVGPDSVVWRRGQNEWTEVARVAASTPRVVQPLELGSVFFVVTDTASGDWQLYWSDSVNDPVLNTDNSWLAAAAQDVQQMYACAALNDTVVITQTNGAASNVSNHYMYAVRNNAGTIEVERAQTAKNGTDKVTMGNPVVRTSNTGWTMAAVGGQTAYLFIKTDGTFPSLSSSSNYKLTTPSIPGPSAPGEYEAMLTPYPGYWGAFYDPTADVVRGITWNTGSSYVTYYSLATSLQATLDASAVPQTVKYVFTTVQTAVSQTDYVMPQFMCIDDGSPASVFMMNQPAHVGANPPFKWGRDTDKGFRTLTFDGAKQLNCCGVYNLMFTDSSNVIQAFCGFNGVNADALNGTEVEPVPAALIEPKMNKGDAYVIAEELTFHPFPATTLTPEITTIRVEHNGGAAVTVAATVADGWTMSTFAGGARVARDGPGAASTPTEVVQGITFEVDEKEQLPTTMRVVASFEEPSQTEPTLAAGEVIQFATLNPQQGNSISYTAYDSGGNQSNVYLLETTTPNGARSVQYAEAKLMNATPISGNVMSSTMVGAYAVIAVASNPGSNVNVSLYRSDNLGGGSLYSSSTGYDATSARLFPMNESAVLLVCEGGTAQDTALFLVSIIGNYFTLSADAADPGWTSVGNPVVGEMAEYALLASDNAAVITQIPRAELTGTYPFGTKFNQTPSGALTACDGNTISIGGSFLYTTKGNEIMRMPLQNWQSQSLTDWATYATYPTAGVTLTNLVVSDAETLYVFVTESGDTRMERITVKPQPEGVTVAVVPGVSSYTDPVAVPTVEGQFVFWSSSVVGYRGGSVEQEYKIFENVEEKEPTPTQPVPVSTEERYWFPIFVTTLVFTLIAIGFMAYLAKLVHDERKHS